jgi:acyl-CoA synthetase (AMP-forming)/AMP-acid ligase II
MQRLAAHGGGEAILWADRPYSFAWLTAQVHELRERLEREGVARGAIVSVRADYSPASIALWLALACHRCVIVPFAPASGTRQESLAEIAQVEHRWEVADDDRVSGCPTGRTAQHSLYARLRSSGKPGLVLFSSGSTGEPKAAVHDLERIAEKFSVDRKRLRAIPLLLYDHIGGVNTMLYTLANGGCLICLEDRAPGCVLHAVERHRVQLLPASPTFLKLVLLSEAHEAHDLSSLEVVSYGTEPMPAAILRRCREVFPRAELRQTYGLSELGILRSKSRSSESLWMRVGGEGFETRVVQGVLHVRARSAMLGYLNAPSPFDEEGWFDTGDLVETDGEFLRIIGRASELINVGGQKVHPAEVEAVIQEVDGVADVIVYGEAHAIVGSIVCAQVRIGADHDPRLVARAVREHCRGRLDRHMVPVKIQVDAREQHGVRLKKNRARQEA